jgi:hypothetical protein
MYAVTGECHLIVINKDDSHEEITAPTSLYVVGRFLHAGLAG